jgi:hypothetical protein
MALTIATLWRHLWLERSDGGRVGNLADASSSSTVCLARRVTSRVGQHQTIDNQNLIRCEVLRVCNGSV